ncbi:MAG: DUF485 domain-containing protein [Emcibacteraceae bacterium]
MRNDDNLIRISNDPKFIELVSRRGRFAWILSIIMLVAYYGFILLIAFDPSFLGTPVSEGSITTFGIPVGMSIIFLSFILTGIYVVRANNEFDEMNKEIVEEYSK